MKRKRGFTGGWTAQPRLFAIAALPVAIPLLLAAVTIEPNAKPAVRASVSALAAPDLRYEHLTSASPAELPEHSIVLKFEANDTLAGVLAAGGLSQAESATLTSMVSDSIDVRRLRPGHLLRFHYDRENQVDAVQLRVIGWGDLDAIRSADGMFVVTPRPASERRVRATIAATIDTSLWDAIRSIGEHPPLVQQLVDIFQWDIDFFGLQQGDRLSIVVEKRYAGSDLVGYGGILAARFEHKGVAYEAFRHESADGRAGYYAAAGSPLRKQFLRAPLKFSRITSGFSKRRFHPILQRFRPHHGVDYGAPVGTPVMTTADGVVVEARYGRGEGNFVRIRHTSRIETYYLHLSRFARGIKRGTRVMQGDVIGYVGMTGLATAPHLDYRVRDNGKWLDPLKLKSIIPDRIRDASLRRYLGNVATLQDQLSAQFGSGADEARKRRALF